MSMQQATYIFLSSSFISETLDLIIAFHCVESSVLFTLVTQYPSETQIMSTVVKILMMSPSTSEKQLPFDLFLFCLSCLESLFLSRGVILFWRFYEEEKCNYLLLQEFSRGISNYLIKTLDSRANQLKWKKWWETWKYKGLLLILLISEKQEKQQ